MKEFLEIKTIVTGSIMAFFGWLITKIYGYYDGKIKSIDSISELKKSVSDLESDVKELNHKVDKLIENMIK